MIVLNSRLKSLIKEILSHKVPVTSEYLAKVLGVTSRTIRNDVLTINLELKKIGVQIEANRGVGYFIDPTLGQPVTEIIEELFMLQEEEQGNVPVLPEERVLYILKSIIMAEDFIATEQIANELFVSKSTVDNDLKQVEKLLEKYDLTLYKKQNYGIKLIGNEMNIRFCFSESLANMRNEQAQLENEIISDVNVEVIKTITKKHLEELPFCMAELQLNNLVTHIAIAIQRIKKGKNIEVGTIELDQIETQEEYVIANRIVTSLEETFSIKIPEGEIAYIAIHLLGAKHFEDKNLQEVDFAGKVGERHYQLVVDILSEINRVYHIDLREDRELIYGLGVHLRSAMNRLKYRMNLRNPMLKEIKNHYPFSFELGILASEIIQKNSRLIVNEDEIGYIAIHLEAAVERMKNKKRREVRRVAIVCASGLGTAKLLAASIESKFPGIDIVGTYPFYSIKNIKNDAADLILSTIPVKEEGPIPLLHINTMLTDQDVEKVKEHISSKYLNEDKNKSLKKLQNLFNEDLFFTEIDKKNPKDIIKSLTTILNIKGFVDDSFQQSVLEREEISPTAIGNLVAIPHPLKPNALGSCIGIGILKKPIKWGENSVQLVFLLALNEKDKEEFSHLFNHLWQLVQNKKLVYELCSKENFADFMSQFYSTK
ncbi:BglG family transcription antiterminator [Metabacillus hrfriensis]|uniref:BglG family transcription antiterminator n=1 Tax=Metabacillus hrfriensis TaxID=3048891 RepID=A0ACD4RC97_9BACI|nr:BglG family transcription antiterminator [Metabacillus sp. CT-WN-B3]WHZ58106.1 BglG family transcription antiterminator [Metabacillus sp. CT-WN-B3]